MTFFSKGAGAGLRAALCLTALLLLSGLPAHAQTPSWHAKQIAAAADGTSRVLWVKAGTTDPTTQAYSGDTVILWEVDAAGNKVWASAAFGPFAGWRAQQIVMAPDGSARLLWGNYEASPTAGLASVWKFGADGSLSWVGSPNPYGPFDGWYPTQIAVAPDGSTRLLWNNYGDYDSTTGVYAGDEATVWNIDGSGNVVSRGVPYGRYTGWYAQQLVAAPDGGTHILWNNYGGYSSTGAYAGDEVTVWTLDANGKDLSIGTPSARYPGWNVLNLDVDRTDGTMKLAWMNADTPSEDLATVWSLDALGKPTSISETFGPYTGWQPDSVAAASDGTARLLWVKRGYSNSSTPPVYSGDQIVEWTVNATGTQYTIGPSYGPYPGWRYQGADLNHADNTGHILWTNSDLSALVWSLGSDGTRTSLGPQYGPY